MKLASVFAVACTKAMVIHTAPLLHPRVADDRHSLLLSHRLEDPTGKTFPLVFAPPGATLLERVPAIALATAASGPPDP
jgi:hypothetical protein